jgi:hypothetical protein
MLVVLDKQWTLNVCSPEFGILAGIAPLTLEFMQKAPLKPKMGTLYG